VRACVDTSGEVDAELAARADAQGRQYLRKIDN